MFHLDTFHCLASVTAEVISQFKAKLVSSFLTTYIGVFHACDLITHNLQVMWERSSPYQISNINTANRTTAWFPQSHQPEKKNYAYYYQSCQPPELMAGEGEIEVSVCSA
jgi:hypothetical protein